MASSNAFSPKTTNQLQIGASLLQIPKPGKTRALTNKKQSITQTKRYS
ncbi:hypothetical protein SynBMKMC1_00318 [Synechococcus sp. BMK-MC-1]|nr:hypothetical protein SynBMKMC1_00318 [Synechococcus sp. BMK-MC-1]